MFSKALVAGTALASVASAAKTCLNQTVPVDIESRNAEFNNVAIPHSNSEVTQFIQNMTRQGQNFTNTALTGYATVKGTYNISTALCWDDEKAPENPTLQILTHGIGFDKTYWDLSYNDFNYSYVNAAIDAGYATLSYDRLGVGNSSHGEPLNEIQVNLEIAGLRALTTQLREGSFPNTPKNYSSVVHVGHSFGSVQSYTFAHLYPNETDGIVLTGFALNSSFSGYFAAGGNFELASLNSPLRFGNSSAWVKSVQEFLFDKTPVYDYLEPLVSNLDQLPAGQDLPDGYIIPANAGANQYQFFLPGYFDPQILVVAESTKQPVTLGELLTLGSISPMNDFAGPVLVITGSADLPFCGGDCLNTGGSAASVPATAAKSFPNVSPDNFTAYIQPNTGHGINAHYNATGAYTVIQDFLKSHGLGSQ